MVGHYHRVSQITGKCRETCITKAEIEWKAAKASSPSKVIPSVPWMLNQIEIMPIPSITNVNPKIYNNVDNKEPSELELTISRTTN